MADEESTDQEDIHDRIKKAELYLKTQDPACINGPVYASMNKHLAELYLELGQYLRAIFHLTEAHACTLRMQAILQYDLKDDYFKKETSSKNSKNPYRAQGIHKEYLVYDSICAKKLEEGVLDRLKEMPKEWTIVQLTREFDPTERIQPRVKDAVSQLSRLHITRLPCGEQLKHSAPLCVTVDMPIGAEDGMPTLFDVIYDSIDKMKYLMCKRSQIRKQRESAGINIKSAVTEITTGWLREWRCLLIGSLHDETIREEIRKSVDNVVGNKSSKSKNYEISSRELQLLYCLADGCAHLEESDIENGVNSIVSDSAIAKNIVQVIMENRTKISQLVVAKRHPVVLILDDQLDCIPWEMTPVLMRHPVCRMPSIHFVHALYKHHESSIVCGNRIVDRSDLGFYIVNPDKDLNEMEKKLVKFLDKRIPEWKGIAGQPPSSDEFAAALAEQNILLYCGHGNGTQHLSAEKIQEMRVVAVPLLFGCSSVKRDHLGGRVEYIGISDKYMIAGSACVLGMIWSVTTGDTDNMTATLLNNWLVGEPLDLEEFGFAPAIPSKEPELLRVLKPARDSAKFYMNSAALVARGIPVKMKYE